MEPARFVYFLMLAINNPALDPDLSAHLRAYQNLYGPLIEAVELLWNALSSIEESEQLTRSLGLIVAMPVKEGPPNAPPLDSNLTGYTVLNKDLRAILEQVDAITLFWKVLVANLSRRPKSSWYH